MIGVLERAGLRERARAWILGFARLTLARLLIAYLALRQLLGMIGLINDRRPRADRAAAARADVRGDRGATLGPLDDETRERVRALAAATDNIGLFFGEDVFLAFGAVLLIQSLLQGPGRSSSSRPSIALWALPTAIAAFVVHGVRIVVFQRRLERRLAREHASATTPPAGTGSSAELTLTHIFYLIGALFAGTAVLDARDRRWRTAAFWAIVATPFLAGDAILAAATQAAIRGARGQARQAALAGWPDRGGRTRNRHAVAGAGDGRRRDRARGARLAHRGRPSTTAIRWRARPRPIGS